MIDILKSVFSILSNDTDISAIVGDKIFPNIIPDKDENGNNIEYPAIVMRRVSVDTEYSKTCKTYTSEIEILCWSISYFQVIDMAEKAIKALEFYKGVVEGINISDIRMTGASEDYGKDAYYQQLTFEIR